MGFDAADKARDKTSLEMVSGPGLEPLEKYSGERPPLEPIDGVQPRIGTNGDPQEAVSIEPDV